MLPINQYKKSGMIFRKKFLSLVAPAILIAMLLIPSISTPSSAQVFQQSDCSAPLTTNIDPNYNGPIAVDGYWVDQGVTSTTTSATTPPAKKEIGPGEGTAVYAVILNNKGWDTISSITGFLNLPTGFSPTGESKIPQLLQNYNPASKMASNYALASFYGNVSTGNTFIMYFNVNVLPTAKVGTFPTTLLVNYQIPELNGIVLHCTSAVLQVPFVLPGKIILDVSSHNNNIQPSKNDPITITIANKGSAPATGVVATITNLGQKGNSGSSSSGSLVLSSTTTNIVNLGANQFNLGTIPANGTANISTNVFPSTSAAGQTQDVSIQLTYENAWGALQTTQLNTGIVVSPIPPESLSLVYLGNTTSPVITSGNLANLNFAVANNSTVEASNVIVSLVPQSTSVSVVGPSTWTIPKLESGQQQYLSTQVFAANSLIDTPTSFTLTANYVANGQTNTNSLTLGAFVIGDIKLQIYGLSVNYVGNSPSIAGSLLNQGSTTGLYTTIELTKSPLLDAIRQARLNNYTNGSSNGSSSSFQQAQAQSSGGGQEGRSPMNSQQFIGDLTADSPIPFSIPINGLNLLQPGMYPVSFKITYADDLKNFHTVVLTENLFVAKNQPRTTHVQGSLLDQIFNALPLPVIIGISIAIAAGIGVIIRRRKSRQKLKMLTGADSDIVTVLENADKKQNETK